MDTSLIASTLQNITAAVDIAKSISEFDKSVEDAEKEMKLADMVDILADVKKKVLKLCQALDEKERQIINLKRIFADDDNFIECSDGIYQKDEKGAPTGMPICLKCWEAGRKIDLLENLFYDYQKNNIDAENDSAL